MASPNDNTPESGFVPGRRGRTCMAYQRNVCGDPATPFRGWCTVHDQMLEEMLAEDRKAGKSSGALCGPVRVRRSKSGVTQPPLSTRKGAEMPYAARKDSRCPNGKPFAVVKKDTGAIVPGGCHQTMDEAQAHVAALETNVTAREKGKGGYK